MAHEILLHLTWEIKRGTRLALPRALPRALQYVWTRGLISDWVTRWLLTHVPGCSQILESFFQKYVSFNMPRMLCQYTLNCFVVVGPVGDKGNLQVSASFRLCASVLVFFFFQLVDDIIFFHFHFSITKDFPYIS